MAEETQGEGPQISLVDLQNALRIMDVAAERGAFKGHELTSVGAVRDKLAGFLDAVAPKEEAEAPAAPETKVVKKAPRAKAKA